MKTRVLSFVLMMIFVVGIAVAQTPPKKNGKAVAKTETRADTTKKVTHHHKTMPRKAVKK